MHYLLILLKIARLWHPSKTSSLLGCHTSSLSSFDVLYPVCRPEIRSGLGADSNTPDRWTEHISEFDDILSKLNCKCRQAL